MSSQPQAAWTGGDHPETTEQDLLRRILPAVPAADSAVIGTGDDAALLSLPGGTVLSVDTLVEGPDFRSDWSTPEDLGWKAAAVNLADIAAMGAAPRALLVALVLPVRVPADWANRFLVGMGEYLASRAPGCGIVGGDIASGEVLTIAVTAIGEPAGSPLVRRNGARPGDTIAVAGTLGRAAAGLRHLMAGRASATELRERYPEVVTAQLRPDPPLQVGVAAARAGATAMMDVSDGLSTDLARLAEASGVQAQLDPQTMESWAAQLASISDFELDHARQCVLHGGEDHAMLATFRPGAVLPPGFQPIGVIAEGAGVCLATEPLRPAGWDSLWGSSTGISGS